MHGNGLRVRSSTLNEPATGAILSDMGADRWFIGWDVGGWNCDRNRNICDALVVLNSTAQSVCDAYWGDLRDTINNAESTADFLDRLQRLCKIVPSAQLKPPVIAIDAPLGFPEAFTRLSHAGK